jgi:hypothetical protein
MRPSFSYPVNKLITRCSICGNPVALESSKTDEQGSAVHEECYVGRTIFMLAAHQQSSRLCRTSATTYQTLPQMSPMWFSR